MVQHCIWQWSRNLEYHFAPKTDHSWCRNQSRYAPSQSETLLQCNDISHWLGAYLDWSLMMNQEVHVRNKTNTILMLGPIFQQYCDAVTRLLANGSTAFIWKMCCHWLKPLWQSHNTDPSDFFTEYTSFQSQFFRKNFIPKPISYSPVSYELMTEMSLHIPVLSLKLCKLTGHDNVYKQLEPFTRKPSQSAFKLPQCYDMFA